MSDFNTAFERIFKECSLEEYLPYAEKFRILANHLVLFVQILILLHHLLV